MHRLWSEYGLRPLGVEVRPLRPDPMASTESADILGLFLRSSGYVLVVTTVPTPGRSVPADRRESTLDSPPRPRTLEPSQALPAWAGVLQRLDLKVPVPTNRADGVDALRFLDGVRRVAPVGSEVAALVLRAPGPATALWEPWLLRHPRVHVEFAGDRQRWMDRATARLREVGRNTPTSKRSGASGEMVRAIERFLAGFPADASPFVWAATPTEARAGRAARGLRYDLSVTAHPGFKSRGHVAETMTTVPPPDPRARAMARVIIRKCLGVRPRERVTIETWTSTLDFANALVLETLRADAQPLLLYQDEPTYWAATTEIPAATLARLGEHHRAAAERTDALVSFFGPSDRERYHALPRRTMFKLGENSDALYRAIEKAGARAVQLAIGRVSPESARMYGVDETTWRNELIEGTLVDPESMSRAGRGIARTLERGRELTVTHPNGTRLSLRLCHRPAEVMDGVNRPGRKLEEWSLFTVPAGVVTVALDEGFAEGVFRSNVPNSVGVSDSVGGVADGRWTFRNGRLNGHSYAEGGDLFAQSLGRAGRGRDQVGTLSIGLNPKIETAPLLQDQGRGVVTLQIGRNSHVGGSNRAPWWAWLILRGADLAVDGAPILQKGRIVA